MDKINADVAKLLADTSFLERLAAIGFLPLGGSPTEAQTYVTLETKKWGDIVRRLGVNPNNRRSFGGALERSNGG